MTGLIIRQVVVRKSNTNNIYINNTDINKSNQINPADEADVMEGAPAVCNRLYGKEYYQGGKY